MTTEASPGEPTRHVVRAIAPGSRGLANALVATNVFLVPDVLSAAAEPNRRRILQLLTSGPHTVNELAARFPVTRSAVSQHLGVLAEVELVTHRKEGRQRFYELSPVGMARLRAEIDRFWTAELDQLVVDATTSSHRSPTRHLTTEEPT